MLTFREMCREDLAQVAEIEKACFSIPWSMQGFADSMALPDTLYLVALEDGEIAGYCGLFQSFDEADITNVAIREQSRGQGAAFAMLAELMRRGEERGITAFTLEVRVSNGAARRLYEKLGFEEVGIRPDFYEKPREAAAIMWKRSLNFPVGK